MKLFLSVYCNLEYIISIQKWLSTFYVFIPMGTCLLKNVNFDQTNCVSWYLRNRYLAKIQKQNSSSMLVYKGSNWNAQSEVVLSTKIIQTNTK